MSQTSPETEILPCPFCGSKPVTERTGFSLRAMYIYCINDNGCPRPKAIGETEEKAIENWNLRFDFAPTPAEPHEATYLRGWNEGVEASVQAARDGFERAMDQYVLIGPSGMAMTMINSVKALSESSPVRPDGADDLEHLDGMLDDRERG